MRQKGLVMEVKVKKAIVLGKDGRFYTTAAQSGWEIGQEITWDPNLKHRPYRVPIWQKTLAAGAAACLMLGGGLWYAVQHSTITRAYAYVSVDINPSILYTLNHREKVIAAKGLNADGKTLLTQLHPKGEGLEQVLTDTVKTAVLNHMLPKKDTILVTAAPIQSNEDVSTLMSMARSDMEQAVTMNPQAAKQDPGVYSLPVSAAVSQAAQKLGVSPGKLLAYLAAHKAGQNVQMTQLHGQVLKNILTDAQLPNVLTTIQGDNVSQIEDWVSKEMSAKEHPASQTQKENNSSQKNGDNVVRSSTANPSNPPAQGQSQSNHSQTPSKSSKGTSNGNGNGQGMKGIGKYSGNTAVVQNGHNGKSNNGNHYGQLKHNHLGSSAQNAANQIFSLGRDGKYNQPGSYFVQNVMRQIESMGGDSTSTSNSASTENTSADNSSTMNGTQSSKGDQGTASNQTETDNSTQNSTSNDTNTVGQSTDGSGNLMNGTGGHYSNSGSN